MSVLTIVRVSNGCQTYLEEKTKKLNLLHFVVNHIVLTSSFDEATVLALFDNYHFISCYGP